MSKPKKILLIGPITSDNPLSIGGTTKSFMILLDYFRKNGIPHEVIAVNRYFGRFASVKNALDVIFRMFLHILSVKKVMANFNPRGLMVITPILFLISRLLGRKFIFRMFGGNLIEVYKSAASYQKWLIRNTCFRSDLILLQTKRVINFFKPFSPKIDWLPTSRKPTEVKRKGAFQKRFVFISQIKKTKGLDLILMCIKELPEDYTIHLYGPILEEEYRHLEKADFYKGVLKPEEVELKLSAYDVLMLPTFHPGEGYPGILIEAYSTGLPVISTQWMAIPELIEHGKTGLIIPPRDTKALKKAILSFNEENYLAFTKNATDHFENFNSDMVNRHLVEKINKL